MAVVPELVFINCCFLGRMKRAEPNRNHFAASLAECFIKMGVRVVIAAGWAVDDTAAEVFAGSFYAAMLDGMSFGEAVTAARRAAKEAAPGTNTWAAYQCYGDPAYRFNGKGSSPERKIFLSPREAVCEIRAIRERSADDENGALLKELAQAENLIPHEWLMQFGEIRAALGSAYGAIGKLDRAIEHLEQAILCPDGRCTLSEIDELTSLMVRSAEQKGGVDAEQMQAQAREHINQLFEQRRHPLKS